MKTVTSLLLIAVLLTSAVPPMYAGAQASDAEEPSREFTIHGAGASFPFPLIDLWRVKYAESNPSVHLNYNSIGSGGGVKQHIERTVAFSASDAPLTDLEYERVPDSITIPETIGAISLVYNIPGVSGGGLNLAEDALCGIFLGDITEWNDPAIADHNPDLDLPDESIVVAHRSDGSGTTFALTGYLAKVCPAWEEQVGAGKSVQWPAGVGAAGNEGVAQIVRTTDNSLGYVTLAYAFQTDMTVAAVRNGDNTNFVLPTLDTASAASAGKAADLPRATESWKGVDLLAAPGMDSYPITSFSYLLLHSDLQGSVKDREEAKATVDLIAWMITDGQEYASGLLYVPISAPVVNLGLEGLAQVTYDGETLYTGPTSIDEEESLIPGWIAGLFGLYAEGQIDDNTLIQALQFLINEGIIQLE